jgi:hypothetical protein
MEDRDQFLLGWRRVLLARLWVPKTSSAGCIDAKRAVESQPY